MPIWISKPGWKTVEKLKTIKRKNGLYQKDVVRFFDQRKRFRKHYRRKKNGKCDKNVNEM